MAHYAPNTYRKGLLPLIILLLLKKNDLYGYQIVRELAAQTDGIITTQEGAIYPAMYLLSSEGYISERKVLVKEKRFRIIYHLEPAGEEYLKEQIDEYEKVVGVMKRLIDQAKEVQ